MTETREIEGVTVVTLDGPFDVTNAGDVISLMDHQGTLARQVSWGDCDGHACATEHLPFGLEANQSVTRDPPSSGGFVLHSTVDGRLFSPGTATRVEPRVPALNPTALSLLVSMLGGTGLAVVGARRSRSE